MLASKHQTLVLGIDVHFIMIMGVPTPIPHPFIGVVFDVGDLLPFIGATVYINYVPRGVSTTGGMIGSMKHIPLGGPFVFAPLIAHESKNFFGSPRVVCESNYLTPAGFSIMTCNDIGVPLAFSPGKNFIPTPSLFLPSSCSIPLPIGKPVMVGGPYVPDIGSMISGLVAGYLFGAFMKGGGMLLKKLGKALNNKFKLTSGLQKALCKLGFEPIDLVDGRVLYEGEDFYLPGIIPISWKRNWYSDSGYEGILGHGVHNNYDISLHIEEEHDVIAMILPDGRLGMFQLIKAIGESDFNRAEKLTITVLDKDHYTVRDHRENLTYSFKKMTDTMYRPVSLNNDDGIAIQFRYNEANHLHQMIDSVGRIIDINVDGKGRVLTVTASHQGEQRTLISYAYNSHGDLEEIIDALDQSTVMEFENHLMVKKTDRNGQAFYWEYDGQQTGARCVKTWGDGGILAGTVVYKDKHNLVTDSLGRTTVYHYNGDNLCTQVTDPLGNHTFHEFTEFMEPYRDIDQEGNVTGYTYDKRGNLVGVHQPDGSIISYFYDDDDRLTMVQNPEGAKNIRIFKDNRLQTTITPAGAVTSYQYSEKGQIKAVSDDVGNTSHMEYDTDGNLVKLLGPEGGESEWMYDAWGRCTQSSNPQKEKQSFIYDALDRVREINAADNNVINLAYNAYDEVIRTIDSKQHQIEFAYTPMGSLKARVEKGKRVDFKYNTAEELVSVTNGRRESYIINRNKNGEVIKEIGFDGTDKRYKLDRAGKIIRVDRAENRFTEYEYDTNGRLTRVEHYDGTWQTYSYDRAGNIIEACSQDSEVRIIRNEAGAVIKEIQDGYEVSSVLDKVNKRVKLTSSLGVEVDLKRDTLGQVIEMSSQSLKETNNKPWNAQFEYNSLGQEIAKILPGNIVSRTAYDFAGRPIEHRVGKRNLDARHRTYQWDVNNQLREMKDQLKNGKVTYTHDDFSNLSSARYEDNSIDYKLPDELGNLHEDKDRKERVYDKGSRLIQSRNGQYGYDVDGNLVSKRTDEGTWSYDWFGNGMLKTVKKPNGQTISYEYDALARRTAKISGASIKRWVWDGHVPLHEWEYSVKDRPKSIVNIDGVLTKDREEPVQNLITWLFDDGSFRPAAKITEHGTYSIVTDYLGTPHEMYDEQGKKVWEVEYDIYGRIRKQEIGSADDCPFRYQGQYDDLESGLYYNRYRYYDPNSGTYISKDPMGVNGGMPNLYAYVYDTNYQLDPFGQKIWTYKNMPKIDNFQLHHVLPKSLAEGANPHEIFNILDDYNIHNIQNTIYLPTDREFHPTRSIHDGYDRFHAQYNRDMRASLDDISAFGKANNWSKEQYQEAVDELTKSTRQDLRQGKLKINCKG